jgi:hypothetical protein
MSEWAIRSLMISSLELLNEVPIPKVTKSADGLGFQNDTSMFSGHSTRSTLTSKARAGGVSLQEILKMANWSGPSSFLRFYYRPVFSSTFARAVLAQD